MYNKNYEIVEKVPMTYIPILHNILQRPYTHTHTDIYIKFDFMWKNTRLTDHFIFY